MKLLFLHLIFLAAMAALPLVAEAKNADLRVMSFNLRNSHANDGENSWQHRRGMAADLIHAHHIDLLGVQEAFRDQLDDLLAALPEYGEVGVGRDDGKSKGEHSQILYRRDRFRVTDHGTFWFSDTPEVPGSATWGNHVTRICTWARLEDKKSRKALYFYNMHLDHESQPSREKSAKLLLDRIRERKSADPVIVTGDFNAEEANPAIHLLQASENPHLVETFRALHPEEKAVATFHGFNGGTQGDKIDYIFATAPFHILDAAILHDSKNGRFPSDHYPVIAVLDFGF